MRPVLHVVITLQVDEPPAPPALIFVQIVQVREIAIILHLLYRRVVDVRCSMYQMLRYIARPEVLSREQMHIRRMVPDILRYPSHADFFIRPLVRLLFAR